MKHKLQTYKQSPLTTLSGVQPTARINVAKQTNKTPNQNNKYFLSCHFKLLLTLSYKFRSLWQKHLLPFLKQSAWFWSNHRFLKNEFPQLTHIASNFVNAWRWSCMKKFRLLIALKGMGLQLCCSQRTFSNVQYQSRITELKVDTPYGCSSLLLVKTSNLRNSNFWCALKQFYYS